MSYRIIFLIMKIKDRYFLPTNTHSVHGSTSSIKNNHVVFSWFGGSKEGSQDTCIYLYNLNGKGKTITIGSRDYMPRWNPVLFNLNGKIILFEKVGGFCDKWQTFYHDITSWDMNITDKEIRETAKVLPAGLNGPVKTSPLIYNGIIYCGSSVETFYDWTSYIEEYYADDKELICFKRRSKPLIVKKEDYIDKIGRSLRTLGVIQPSLYIDKNNLCALFRSSSGISKIYFSKYDYEVDNWTYPIPTNLENPNSAIDVKSNNGRIYLAWNPSSSHRYPLYLTEISMLYDGHFEILDNVIICDDIDEYNFIEKGCISPELSYPYITIEDKYIHLSYTYGRNKIEYCKVEI